jgi:hypothetical protein
MQEFSIQCRLGNQLFQFAHIYSMVYYVLPDKEYSLYFNEKIPDIDFNRLAYPPKNIGSGMRGQFLGYSESEIFFEPNLTRSIYSPSVDKVQHFSEKYGDLTNSLLICVRRGDFVGLRTLFMCCNSKYYETCYQKLTSNGEKYDKILLTTDDFEWCKQNIHIPQDVIYLEDETPFDTIMLASLCKDFIINTSTFSWWCAWMGEPNGGRIICPDKKFLIAFEQENKVFFPERWTKVENMEGLYEK